AGRAARISFGERGPDRTELRLGEPGPGRGAQRVPRTVDAVAQRPMASAASAAVAWTREPQCVFAERARRSRPARAREWRRAWVGIAGRRRSRAARSTRLRRDRATLPV